MGSCTVCVSSSKRPITSSEPLHVEWLGRVPYAEALKLQEECVDARRAGERRDTLLLLEHPPTVTLGRRSESDHLLVPEAALAARGVSLHHIARGGDVTYHGPGQLVGYPIIHLKERGAPDVVAFLRRIETLLIEALQTLGIEGYTRAGYTGVFASPDRPGRPRKIASIGIGVRRWVTFHGFALNVTLDPAEFDVIVPCGLPDVQMTSVAREGAAGDPETLELRTRDAVAEAFLGAYP